MATLDRNRGRKKLGLRLALAEQTREEMNDEQWIQLFPVESRRGKRVLASTRPPGGWRLQRSSGERKNRAEKKEKLLTGLRERAAGRRHRGHIKATSRSLASKNHRG